MQLVSISKQGLRAGKLSLGYLQCLAICFLIFSCGTKKASDRKARPVYRYGTKSDSALLYFNQGWEYIMDKGQWTLAEAAFRKAVDLDTTFLIGKSLVGKITRNLEERQGLLSELKQYKSQATEEELCLLEITMKTMELLNARDKGFPIETNFYETFIDLGYENYKRFVHKYPAESYMLAEYIEFIHAKFGPEIALDSIQTLPSALQKELPFFKSYQAVLAAETGDFEKALSLADELDNKINDKEVPSPYFLFAQIYTMMDSLPLAKKYIDEAVRLDTNHMLARRLQLNLEKKTN